MRMKAAGYLYVFRAIFAVILAGLLWSGTAQAQENAQNKSLVYVRIYEWWQKSSKEQIQVDPSIQAIGLRSGEVAYLAATTFLDRGRNSFWGTLLVRPAVQEVMDVSDIIKNFKVMDLDGDGVSEVFADAFGSGQGSTIGTKAIIQFDGSEPIFLRKIEYEEHGGALIDQSISVEWHVAAGAKLIEQVDKSEDGKSSTTLSALRLENGKLIPVRENIAIRWPGAKKQNPAKLMSNKARLEAASYSANFNAVVKSYRETTVKPSLTYELARAVESAEKASQDEKFHLRHGIAAYTDILNKAPWWAPGYVRKAKLHAALGQYVQALAVAHQYSQLEPNDPEVGGLGPDMQKWKTLAEASKR